MFQKTKEGDRLRSSASKGLATSTAGQLREGSVKEMKRGRGDPGSLSTIERELEGRGGIQPPQLEFYALNRRANVLNEKNRRGRGTFSEEGKVDPGASEGAKEKGLAKGNGLDFRAQIIFNVKVPWPKGVEEKRPV